MGEEKNVTSSLGFRYSKLRDHPLHTAHWWLEMKREQDGAESLWRIHDGLYDFSNFIEEHPGGSEWLEVTKVPLIFKATSCLNIYNFFRELT